MKFTAKKMLMSRRLLLLSLVVMAVLSLTGCEKKHTYASVDSTISEKLMGHRELESRFLDYWDGMSKQQYTDTYDFELPYQNFLHDKAWYLEFRSGSRKHFRATLIDVSFEHKNIAALKVRIDVGKTHYVQSDKWIKVNDTWYHKYYDSLLPPH